MVTTIVVAQYENRNMLSFIKNVLSQHICGIHRLSCADSNNFLILFCDSTANKIWLPLLDN
jgi:hypothetical protein